MRIYSLLLLLLFQLLLSLNVLAQESGGGEDVFSQWYKEFYEAAEKAKEEGTAETDKLWGGIAGKCKVVDPDKASQMENDNFAKGMGFFTTKKQAQDILYKIENGNADDLIEIRDHTPGGIA